MTAHPRAEYILHGWVKEWFENLLHPAISEVLVAFIVGSLVLSDGDSSCAPPVHGPLDLPITPKTLLVISISHVDRARTSRWH